jgi:hypothetical protein
VTDHLIAPTILGVPTREIMRGDTGPPLEAVLGDDDGPLPLLGASVRFQMRPTPQSGLTVPVINAPAVIVKASATDGDPDLGRVRYVWGPSDTAVASIYRATFEVTFGDGSVRSFPNDEYLTIIVRADVA